MDSYGFVYNPGMYSLGMHKRFNRESERVMKGILVPPGMPGKPVDITDTELELNLGFVSFAYPFDDPVCLAHDDDGIANRRPPNRTINGNESLKLDGK